MQRCGWVTQDPLYLAYHDTEWGVPVTDTQKLFEMICLEGQMAGLSWLTVLRKRENYRNAFHHFDPQAVALMGEADVDRLMLAIGEKFPPSLLMRGRFLLWRLKVRHLITISGVLSVTNPRFTGMRIFARHLPSARLQTPFPNR